MHASTKGALTFVKPKAACRKTAVQRRRSSIMARAFFIDKHRLSDYHDSVIQSFKHRGLRRLYKDDDHRALSPARVDKIKRILARLDEAADVRNMALPGFGLHRLRGKLSGLWAVSVSGNWRIVFRFEKGRAYDVDLLDYH